jgi:hypothetical protein
MSTVAEQAGDELEEAAQALRILEAELAGIPARLAEAARAADGERLLVLRRRRDELGAEVFAARVRLLRLEIGIAERNRSELRRQVRAQEDDLAAAAQAAREAFDFAQKKVEEHGAIALRMRLTENAAEVERQRSNELRQQLAALIRDAGGEGGEEAVSYGERTGRPITRLKDRVA